jgi:hypothetical protein
MILLGNRYPNIRFAHLFEEEPDEYRSLLVTFWGHEYEFVKKLFQSDMYNYDEANEVYSVENYQNEIFQFSFPEFGAGIANIGIDDAILNARAEFLNIHENDEVMGIEVYDFRNLQIVPNWDWDFDSVNHLKIRMDMKNDVMRERWDMIVRPLFQNML